MRIRLVHTDSDRDSLLTPRDSRTFDLMLQNSILHDGAEQFHLDAWSNTEWVAFRDNFVPIIMRYWDGKFELTPNRPWYQPRGAQGAAEAARVTCSLSIGLVD